MSRIAAFVILMQNQNATTKTLYHLAFGVIVLVMDQEKNPLMSEHSGN